MNELMLATYISLELAFISLMARFFGKTGLVAAMVSNMFFITVFGAKLVERFGLITNVGNFAFAATFFAFQLYAIRGWDTEIAKWVVFIATTFVTFLSQVILRIPPFPGNPELNQALITIFSVSPRIALASMIAFLFSVTIMLHVFERLKSRPLWQRSLGATIAGQAVDSLLFFPVAFLSLFNFTGVLLAGLLMKVVFGVMTIPFLYGFRKW